MRATPLSVALATLLATTAACGDREGAAGIRWLSIATGGTGGVYYPYGGGIAKILSENLQGVQATAEVTAASVDNLKFIRDGKADLAFTLADSLADAVAGRGPFEGAPVPATSLAVLYTNYTHLVTTDSSPIRRVADLRGRVVSTGSPGSGTEIIAFRVLEAAGLDPDVDVRHQGLGAAESVGALKDGKIEAFFWSGGLPSPAVLDLSHTPGMRIRLVPSDDVLPALQAEYGGLYYRVEFPASAYAGFDEAVAVVGVANVLVANRAMPEDLAENITRLIFERQPELAAIHPEARKLSLESAATGSPAAFHPGAIAYYRARGAWKE